MFIDFILTVGLINAVLTATLFLLFFYIVFIFTFFFVEGWSKYVWYRKTK